MKQSPKSWSYIIMTTILLTSMLGSCQKQDNYKCTSPQGDVYYKSMNDSQYSIYMSNIGNHTKCCKQ